MNRAKPFDHNEEPECTVCGTKMDWSLYWDHWDGCMKNLMEQEKNGPGFMVQCFLCGGSLTKVEMLDHINICNMKLKDEIHAT